MSRAAALLPLALAVLALAACEATPPPAAPVTPGAAPPAAVRPGPTTSDRPDPHRVPATPQPAATSPLLALPPAPQPSAEGVVPVLYYHRVQAAPPGFASWTAAARQRFLAYDTLPSALTAQLDWLREHGYTTVLPRDLAAHWDRGAPLPGLPWA